MKPFKKSKVARATMSRKVYNIVSRGLDDPYWDEGIMFYPRRNRGTNHCHPQLMSYQVRMYKTWKHNRKHQWKDIHMKNK
jgi:hypothetical protein